MFLKTLSLEHYRQPDEYVDWEHPAVRAKALELAGGKDSDEAVAASCFAFVRDQIKHSGDFRMNPITCKASDVLSSGTGFCFAKSHLLAALLRANGIPAGLCYQRVRIAGETPFYYLHGLNAIYLKRFGWYRVDARGNKPGVAAEFCPPSEKLAYLCDAPGEKNFGSVLASPHPLIVETLTRCKTVEEVFRHIPDLEAL